MLPSIHSIYSVDRAVCWDTFACTYGEPRSESQRKDDHPHESVVSAGIRVLSLSFCPIYIEAGKSVDRRVWLDLQVKPPFGDSPMLFGMCL